jgi:PKD repeat protein
MAAALAGLVLGCANPSLTSSGASTKAARLVDDGGNLALTITAPSLASVPGGAGASRVIAAESTNAEFLLNGAVFGNLDLANYKATEVNGTATYKITLDVPVPASGSYGTVGLRFLGPGGNVLTSGSASNVSVALSGLSLVSIPCFPVTATTIVESGIAQSSAIANLAANSTAYFKFSTAGQRSYDFSSSPAGAELFLYGADGKLIARGATISRTFVSPADLYLGATSPAKIDGFSVSFVPKNLAPMITSLAPSYVGAINANTSIAALGSDPEGAPLTFTWKKADGTVIGTGSNLNYQFLTGMATPVTLFLSDGVNTVTRSTTVYVDVIAPPLPVISASTTTIRVGGAIAFDSSGSVLSQGNQITDRLWNFGDGATSSIAAPSHAYASVGTYTARLKVAHVVNSATVWSDWAETIITVTPNSAPTASFLATENGAAISSNNQGWKTGKGVSIHFDGSASSDPDAGDAAGLTYNWEFFDPTYPDVLSSKPLASAASATQDFAFDSFGRWLVRLTVTDALGASSVATAWINVSPYFAFRFYIGSGTTIDANLPVRFFFWDLTTGDILRSFGWYGLEAQDWWSATLWQPELNRFKAQNGVGLAVVHLQNWNLSGMAYQAKNIRDLAGLPHFLGYYEAGQDGNLRYTGTLDKGKAALPIYDNWAAADAAINASTIPSVTFHDLVGDVVFNLQ